MEVLTKLDADIKSIVEFKVNPIVDERKDPKMLNNVFLPRRAQHRPRRRLWATWSPTALSSIFSLQFSHILNCFLQLKLQR